MSLLAVATAVTLVFSGGAAWAVAPDPVVTPADEFTEQLPDEPVEQLPDEPVEPLPDEPAEDPTDTPVDPADEPVDPADDPVEQLPVDQLTPAEAPEGDSLPHPLIAPSILTVNEREPNDSRATAQSFGVTIADGVLGQTVRGRAHRAASTFDDDWYKISLPEPGRVSIDLRFPPPGPGITQSYVLGVYNESGVRLYGFSVRSYDAAGGGIRALPVLLGAGTHYIVMSGMGIWNTWNQEYTLSATLHKGTVERELNGERGRATLFTTGSGIRGSALSIHPDLNPLSSARTYDIDYYRFFVFEPGNHRIDLQFPAGTGGRAYDVHIRRPSDGAIIHRFENVNASHANGSWLRGFDVNLPTAEYYFISVTGWSDWTTWGKEYSLNVGRLMTAGTPTITGTARTGHTITANPGTWSGIATSALKYQWNRNGSPIAGETRSTYVVRQGDIDASITVTVSGARTGYLPASVTSAQVRPGVTFIDVPKDFVFLTEIEWLARAGVSTGWDVGSGRKEFRPFQPVTRDAMAAFLYRWAGSPSYTPPARSPFVDVPTGYVFYKEISWLAAQGISTGWDIGGGRKEFRPFQPVARDAMAAFLYRSVGSPAFTPPAGSPFVDIPRSYVFYKEVSWLAGQGISTGWDIGGGRKEFRPFQPVARDAMAVFMYRTPRMI